MLGSVAFGVVGLTHTAIGCTGVVVPVVVPLSDIELDGIGVVGSGAGVTPVVTGDATGLAGVTLATAFCCVYGQVVAFWKICPVCALAVFPLFADFTATDRA